MLVLVATDTGCRVFTDAGERDLELPGQSVGALTSDVGDACLAIVDGQEIWRRTAGGWSRVATTSVFLESIVSSNGIIFAGSMAEAVVVRIAPSGQAERLAGFDIVPGRRQWFAEGPPLSVRALTATADGSAIMAAVHVGGIPRSTDAGLTWAPTVPIAFDVHEVRAHSSLPNVVAAAAAVGLCVSHDGGATWKVISEGLELTNSLAVAVLDDEVLFSIQDGPFAKRSQLWRWRIGDTRVERVRDGLPEWLEGKVDTAHLAAGGGRAAVVDAGGNLWLASAGSTGFRRTATDLKHAVGLLISSTER